MQLPAKPATSGKAGTSSPLGCRNAAETWRRCAFWAGHRQRSKGVHSSFTARRSSGNLARLHWISVPPPTRGRSPREENLRPVFERTILTYDGLQAAPDDGLRRELLGGDLYVSPTPSPAHQTIVGEIYVTLHAYAKERGGRAFVSPIDVVFSQTDAVQPDIIYLSPDRLSIVGPKYIGGAPSLVVEVLSPSSSDIDPALKLRTYARYGVPEYWIVDPAARIVFAHATPSGEGYLLAEKSGDGSIAAITLPELRFLFP